MSFDRISILSAFLLLAVPMPDSSLAAGVDAATPRQDQERPAASGQARSRTTGTDLSPPIPKTVVELSLDRAIEIALESNLQIQIARIGENVSRRNLVIEKAVFDPLFNVSARYSKNRRPTASFLDIGVGGLIGVQTNPFETSDLATGITGRTLIGTSYSLRLTESGFDRPLSGDLLGLNPQQETTASFQLTQPLFRGGWFGYNSAGIRVASNNLTLSRYDFILALTDVVFQVEQAYWGLLFAQKNLEAKSKALEVTQENYENAKAKQAVGSLAPIDVTTAESQVALRKVELVDARVLVDNARDTLLQILNYSRRDGERPWGRDDASRSFGDIGIHPTSEPDPEPLVTIREEALALAFDLRPEYQQVALQIDNQEIQLNVARNELLPALALTSSWNQHGLSDDIGRSFDSLGTGQFYSWAVGLELEIPIFQRGPRIRLLAAKDVYKQLKLQRADLENLITVEVDQSLRDIETLSQKVRDLEARVQLQREILDAERKKLEVGKSIPYIVSTVENDLVDSAAQSIRAKADLQTAKATFYRATGQLLEIHNITVDAD